MTIVHQCFQVFMDVPYTSMVYFGGIPRDLGLLAFALPNQNKPDPLCHIFRMPKMTVSKFACLGFMYTIHSISQAPNLVSLAKKTAASCDNIINDPFAINRQISKLEESLAPDLKPREIKRESLAAKSYFSSGKVGS